MKATVVRIGSHQGELFAEVEHSPDGAHASPLVYAVPVSTDLPIGTVVDIVVTVAEVPKVEPTAADFGDVSIADPTPLVVPDSPIAPAPETGEKAFTSPSGQAKVSDKQAAVTNAKIAAESTGGPKAPITAVRNEGTSPVAPATKGKLK